MEKNKVEEFVQDMVGKTFLYDKKHLHIDSYRMATEKVIIHTDKINVPIPYSEFKTEIVRFGQPEIGSAVSKDTTGTATATVPSLLMGDTMKSLSEVLLDNINKIKENPSYIPQASAINDQVKTVIDLGKSQIEMMKLQFALQNAGGR